MYELAISIWQPFSILVDGYLAQKAPVTQGRVVPGALKLVEGAETAAYPAKTTRAMMDERSSDFIGEVSYFSLKGVLGGLRLS